jgi:hypothetical protein
MIQPAKRAYGIPIGTGMRETEDALAFFHGGT